MPGVNVTLSPSNPPILIPASGGSFSYTATLLNLGSLPSTFDVWIMVQLPNLTWYGPALGPLSLTLPGNGSLTRLRTQNVPGSAPAGNYWYEARVGTYPSAVWNTSGFAFVKSMTGDGGWIGDWTNWGDAIGNEEAAVSAVTPVAFALLTASPNPFNPSTVLRYQLPMASLVSLRVYDTAGRLVETLVDGYRAAGSHEVTFDASNLASGLYIYQLSAGNFNATGKMVLMK
jgi:hypothetical protein